MPAWWDSQPSWWDSQPARAVLFPLLLERFHQGQPRFPPGHSRALPLGWDLRS